ncbi:IS110 family transposase [Streptomyces sp. XY413]|uniref:IS110 family transposase n=1 Tax=Streptomyces sp. XY413 TaxID=1519479 RepID=UPI000D14900F|nr:transposase [Streptomyces sp. XY413]
MLSIPGRTVHHASRGYRGDGKTDAKDAYVIADQARMRRDLPPLQEWDKIAVDLKILTARRYDLAADRTHAINRMRAQLLEYFPGVDRLPDPSQPASARPELPRDLAEEPQSPRRPGHGRCSRRRGPGPAHRRGRGEHSLRRRQRPGPVRAGSG